MSSNPCHQPTRSSNRTNTFSFIILCSSHSLSSILLVSASNTLMWQIQYNQSSYRDSIQTLEADIQHANALAAALPREYGGNYFEMRLSYSPFAQFFLYCIEWLDISFTDTPASFLGLLHILIHKVYVDGMPSMSSKERKATVKEFYAVIYPLLKQLESELLHMDQNAQAGTKGFGKKKLERNSSRDQERDGECGICMENNTKMLLPNCGHSMCITCFHDWNSRSESCPFCRGNLKRVASTDLWVVVNKDEVIDTDTLAKDNLHRFYDYMETLPLIVTDINLSLYDYIL